MVSYLVGGVFEKCKEEVSNDINKLAYSVQQIFQSSVKFTIIPAKTAKLLKLGIWYDFVKAVDESINNGKELFWFSYNVNIRVGVFMETDLLPDSFFFKLVK